MRRFVYDADGRVLGEYGASATDVKAEFVWALPEVANDDDLFGGDDGAGGYMPLAVATPDGGGAIVLNWVHGSHLGVPLVNTDSAGNAAACPTTTSHPVFPARAARSQTSTITDTATMTRPPDDTSRPTPSAWTEGRTPMRMPQIIPCGS